ncbi:MAG TPA: carboxypeptidase-like regulatory domain-containing protein, partial [Longimicrobiales bacterium]
MGRVIDADTHEPLANAQVVVVGTQRGSLTNSDGRYVIPQVPSGARSIRVTLLGYSERGQPVTVAVGSSVTVNFELSQAAVELNAVVVTGTPGATQKRAIGNSVASIAVSDLTAKAAVTNVTQVLSARTPGLTIMQGSGTPGTASNIRIRGISSINSSNQPVFYIDGVRMQSGSQGGFGVGGQ